MALAGDAAVLMLRAVRLGLLPRDPLVIPAAAYNAFIDAALDFRQRTAHLGQGAQPSFSQASIVLVRNDSGSNQNRMAVLGVDAPIIDPSANEEEFRNRVALACVAPEEGTHEGRFVVLAEPIAHGKIGRAYAAGVCPVKVDVPDEEHEWRYAEIADGITANLKVSMQGSAGILWRAGGTGVQWAVIRLGQPVPMHVFPVELTHVGGEQLDVRVCVRARVLGPRALLGLLDHAEDVPELLDAVFVAGEVVGEPSQRRLDVAACGGVLLEAEPDPGSPGVTVAQTALVAG
jgi:hypothetical protein